MTIYTFRQNGFISPVDAQTVGEELSRIESRDGVIDAHVVVNESRPDDAPLHPHFEWDDVKAAERWRVEQSRRLIRSVEIVRDPAEPAEMCFVNVQSQGGYVSAAVVQSRPDLHEEAMRLYAERVHSAVAQLAKVEALAPSDQRQRIKEAREALQQLATI